MSIGVSKTALVRDVKTLFVVGSARFVGNAPDGVVIRRLTKKQLEAAKAVLALGLTRDEWDDLEEQLCQERKWKQEALAWQREHRENVQQETIRREVQKAMQEAGKGFEKADFDKLVDSLESPKANDYW